MSKLPFWGKLQKIWDLTEPLWFLGWVWSEVYRFLACLYTPIMVCPSFRILTFVKNRASYGWLL